MSDIPAKVVDLLAPFSQRERDAYAKHMAGLKAGTEKPLSSVRIGQMYELFLVGGTTIDVARANPGILLGAIVRAAVEEDWHQRRQDYISGLLGAITERTIQVQSEAVVFIGKLLAATHRCHEAKLDAYLQTNDPKDLADLTLAVGSIEQYRKILELMLKLTGQDKAKQPYDPKDPPKDVGEGSSPTITIGGGIGPPGRALASDEAAILMAALNKT